MKAKATRANGVATGAKVMVAAASVAVTIGGWAAISVNDMQGSTVSTQAVVEQSTTNLTLPLPQINPLPTVMPAQNITVSSASNITAPPLAAAATSTAPPIVAVPTATPLRAASPSTSSRPRPVTRSRSSR